MRKKRLVIFSSGVLAFLALEVGVVVFWTVSIYRSQYQRQAAGRHESVLRLGILPVISKVQATKNWLPFLDAVNKNKKVRIKPFFANSFEDIVIGLKYGVLDLAYVDSSLAMKLESEVGVKKLACLGNVGSKGYYSILLARNDDVTFLSDTKDKRLLFANRYSATGHAVPQQYLRKKLAVEPHKWFKTIRYAGNDNQAIRELITGRADVIAINHQAFKSYMANNNLAEKNFSVVWMFRNVPPHVVCYRAALDKKMVDVLDELFLSSSFYPDGQKELFLDVKANVYQAKLQSFLEFMKE